MLDTGRIAGRRCRGATLAALLVSALAAAAPASANPDLVGCYAPGDPQNPPTLRVEQTPRGYLLSAMGGKPAEYQPATPDLLALVGDEVMMKFMVPVRALYGLTDPGGGIFAVSPGVRAHPTEPATRYVGFDVQLGPALFFKVDCW